MDHSSRAHLIIRTCAYILDNHRLCRAAARRKHRYCAAHLRLQIRRRRMARAARSIRRGFRLPHLNNLQAVATGLARVRLAQASGHMDARTAGLMRYSLRLARGNLRFLQDQFEARFEVDAPCEANSNIPYHLQAGLLESRTCRENTS